jgi:hypothetical protein
MTTNKKNYPPIFFHKFSTQHKTQFIGTQEFIEAKETQIPHISQSFI